MERSGLVGVALARDNPHQSAALHGGAWNAGKVKSHMASNDQSMDDRAATSTSRSLLARVSANDPDAWDRLVTLYAPLIWHWCRKLSLPEQEIADVFQEVCRAVASRIG